MVYLRSHTSLKCSMVRVLLRSELLAASDNSVPPARAPGATPVVPRGAAYHYTGCGCGVCPVHSSPLQSACVALWRCPSLRRCRRWSLCVSR
jgi:hypothetical protein